MSARRVSAFVFATVVAFGSVSIDGSQSAPRAARAPKVACGTVMIPADERIDPRMRVGKPRDTTKYAIDAAEPPICRDK